MPTVTLLARVGGTRTRIELDGENWRTVPTAVVDELGLTVGVDLDRALARDLRRALRRSRAIGHAERLLAHADRSRAALADALERRGVSPAERRALLDQLERAGLVSDSRSAAARAATLAERGWGNVAIAYRLEGEGFSDEARSAALAALGDEVARARTMLDAKARTPAQAARLLSQRGFDPDVCEELLHAYLPLEG